jgi:hypothetical protein
MIKKKLKSPKKYLEAAENSIFDQCLFNHSCLYGHRNIIKKIIANFKDDISVNSVILDGNTAIHLAIQGIYPVNLL